MAEHNFLLTYSVDAKADKVRGEIAKIEKWDKLANVETTFKGTMTIHPPPKPSNALLRAILLDFTKTSAITAVKNEFLTILVANRAEETDVVIHCAMMVEGVEGAFEFEVSN